MKCKDSGNFLKVTLLVVNFYHVILFICWLWCHCNCFVMQMKHGLNVIFSFNFGFLPKIHFPIPCPPILLSFYVFLQLPLHPVYLFFITLTLLMHYIKLLSPEFDLLPQLFNHRINFLQLILPQCTRSLDLIDLKCDVVDLCLDIGFLFLDELSQVVVASLYFFKVMAQFLHGQLHIWFVLFFNAVDLEGFFRVFLLQILHK